MIPNWLLYQTCSCGADFSSGVRVEDNSERADCGTRWDKLVIRRRLTHTHRCRITQSESHSHTHSQRCSHDHTHSLDVKWIHVTTQRGTWIIPSGNTEGWGDMWIRETEKICTPALTHWRRCRHRHPTHTYANTQTYRHRHRHLCSKIKTRILCGAKMKYYLRGRMWGRSVVGVRVEFTWRQNSLSDFNVLSIIGEKKKVSRITLWSRRRKTKIVASRRSGPYLPCCENTYIKQIQ